MSLFALVLNLGFVLAIVGMAVYVTYAIHKPQLEVGHDQHQLPEQFRTGSDPESSVSEESQIDNRVRDRGGNY